MESPPDQTITRDSTTNSLNWRVFDIKNGQVRLISDKATTSSVHLIGANAYNNGVKILNDLCETLYSNPGVGTAQSMKIEDIEDKMNLNTATGGWDFATYVNAGVEYGSYGDKLTGSYKQYPNIFYQEDGQKVNEATHGTLGLSEQTEWVTGINNTNTSITPKLTGWYGHFKLEDAGTEWKDSKYYELFFIETHGLASRMVVITDIGGGIYRADFSIREIGLHKIDPSQGGFLAFGGAGFSSKGLTVGSDVRVRPMVTLEPDVKVDMTNKPVGETSPTNAWKLQ